METLGVPDKYEAACSRPGTIETFTYRVKGIRNGDEIEKTALVYLPSSYSPENQYNILYLVHGSGDNETSWFTKGHDKDVIDNLIFYGDIEPLIIVTPTLYYPDGFCSEPNEKPDSGYEQFAEELRHYLLPAVEAKYAGYAGGDVSEQNLIETRTHRAMAGLSMGSMTTINAGMMRSLDLFSWFGTFSGAHTEASDISAALHSSEFEPYPIDYLLATNGKFDFLYKEHTETFKELERTEPKLTDGVNYSFIEIRNGSHDWPSWELALYDLLQILFR